MFTFILCTFALPLTIFILINYKQIQLCVQRLFHYLNPAMVEPEPPVTEPQPAIPAQVRFHIALLCINYQKLTNILKNLAH